MEPQETTALAPEANPTATRHEQQLRGLVSGVHLDPSFADDLVRRQVGIEVARREVFDALHARSMSFGPFRSVAALASDGAMIGGVDAASPEGRINLYSEVLASRCGGPAPSDAARPFGRLRVSDMARDLLELRGIRTTTMSTSELVTRALHGTSDFPGLLASTGDRVLRRAYTSYQGGIRRACRQSTARDFRAKQMLALGEAPELEKVNEHGEFKRGTMSETKESYSLNTFGKIFGITRQALVNDDLEAFGSMSMKLGIAAAEFESKQLATLLTSNPTMGDGFSLFHANHGNLATPGAITNTTLAEARRAMRMQTGIDRKTPIDVQPRYVIIPAALELAVDLVLSPVYAPDFSKVNLFNGFLEKIVDPRLDAISTTAWYMSADPALFDTIEYSYLEEQPGPQITTREGFNVDGLEVKVHLDFGAGVLDFRGLYRNAGA